VSRKPEAVMKEADLFRQYSEEAVHSSSHAKSKNEKQALIDLACTWAHAALMSERLSGSSFVSPPPGLAPKETHHVF
jgi:hypothetical protein